MGEVERRWVGRFLRPLEPSDEPRFSKVYEMLDGMPGPAREDLERLRLGELLPVEDEDRRIDLHYLGAALAFIGVATNSGLRWPDVGSSVRLLGVIAEGIPEATWDRYRHHSTVVEMLRASMFVEALPLDADLQLLERAFLLLPEDPWTHGGGEPTYEGPLTGAWAEWVENARAMLEVAGLVEPSSTFPGEAA